MGERVNTSTNQVESVWVPFAIDQFKIKDPLEEELVSNEQLFS